jgi:hypothetical protein
LEELQALGKVKFCGDYWECTDCNHDITKDVHSWYQQVMENAKFLGKDLKENLKS